MSAMFVLIVGLAAVFGFLFGVYLFVFRLKLARPLRLVGGIIGGLVLAFGTALLVTLLLWPPVSFLLVGGFLVAAVLLTGYVFFGGTQAESVLVQEGLSETRYDQNGGNLDEDLDGYGLDLDVGTRS